MTNVPRASGLVAPTNELVSREEKGVGMTAGYSSAIKKVKCTYKEPFDAQDSFVVNAWPSFELPPTENIRAMFIKDMNGKPLEERDVGRLLPSESTMTDDDRDQHPKAVVALSRERAPTTRYGCSIRHASGGISLLACLVQGNLAADRKARNLIPAVPNRGRFSGIMSVPDVRPCRPRPEFRR